jgi:hypothetical protein
MEPEQGQSEDYDRQDGARFFAGMDWGGSFHQLCVVNVAGQLILQQRITHDVAAWQCWRPS